MGSAFLAKGLGTKDFKGTQKRQKGVFDLIIKAAVLLHSVPGTWQPEHERMPATWPLEAFQKSMSVLFL